MQFPGSATEPAKSGPAAAQVLRHLYKEHIAPFETWYMTVIQEYKKQHANAALQAAMGETRYSLHQILQMVNLSPADLQNQGMDENTMQILETHKGTLQRILQEQRIFAEGVRNNTAQNMGHGDQNGAIGHRPPTMGPSPPFGAVGSHTPQQNLLSMASHQQIPRTLMQQGQHPQSNGVDVLGARLPGQQIPSMGPQGNNLSLKPSLGQAQIFLIIDQYKNEYAMSRAFFIVTERISI